jgi:hypothetical protein
MTGVKFLAGQLEISFFTITLKIANAVGIRSFLSGG